MNYFSIDFFYGIGLTIEAVSNLPKVMFDEDDEELEELMLFNGVLIDVLCFRIIIGRLRECEAMP